MFFQVNITPKAKKTAESIAKAKVNNSYNLLLAPFQPPTRIKLDTQLNSSVECELTIKNSNNRHLTVLVSKAPPEERFVTLSASEWSIDPESSAILNIKWEPKEEGSWRDVLQLSDSRRIKYDVPLILTSTNPNKGIKKKGALGKTRTKTSVASRANNEKSVINKQATTKRTRATSIEVTDKENRLQNVGVNWMLNQAQSKRQKRAESPQKTLDFSKYLDSSTFKFTPLKSRFSPLKSSLNPIQTPQNVETRTNGALRKDTYITVPKFLNVLEDVGTENGTKNEFDDSLSPKRIAEAGVPSEMSALFNDIKFTPFKSPNTKRRDEELFSPQYCSTSQKSVKNGDSDDSLDKSSGKNATFEIEWSASIEKNSTFELPKSPKSTRNSTHLQPLCLAKEFARNNLEFSTPLHHQFSKSQIDHGTATPLHHQFSKSQIDGGSAKDCLEADLWIKSKNTSLSPISKSLLHSTLESIREEDIGIKVPVQNPEMPNAMCIEISPPKKHGILKSTFVRRKSPVKTSVRKVAKEERAINLKKKIKGIPMNKGDNLAVKIPGVKIAKLSLSKQLLSSVDKDESQLRTLRKEPSVKLHDPNDFLSMFCNPDPFAATMTQDPFLASTMYYDDKWIFIQELEFKKWLNALLTAPEHLSADVESTKIDVGKVWQCCRAKETVVLAETKESISARYHTNTRLNTLRKAACAMFRKAEVIEPLSRTTVGIEKEILVIRPDKDLHRDIGLQKIILELFISYNPLWLRIGLETIYGETIPLHSNNDLIGLSRFLLSRFFSDPFIVKQHSASSHPNIRLPSFQPFMNKFMLKKFLFLVFFLDHAKRNKLIGHDPCLFHKKALIKDSRSILLTFSRELLGGIGDVTKVLRQYGYAVSHKQTFLDEYDYALTNLCTDLRDGVRLCRIMELVSGNRCLTCRCRVPAISRLQKVHNVSIALTALAQAGYTITGGIEAKCIADGHREKTLSLLWQIIYRYQRPRFERAAATLQRWWRARMWLPRLRRMIASRRHEAAAVIQRAWKSWRARRELVRLRQERQVLERRRCQAARMLQRCWRRHRQFLLRRAAALRIQIWWRRMRDTRPYVQDLANRRRLIVLLQRRWRSAHERRHLLRLKRSAVLLQTRWRFLRQRRAAHRIQAHWRAVLLGRSQRRDYTRLRHSAVAVQARWRALQAQRRFLTLRRACLRVQAIWRGRRVRKGLARLRWAVSLLERRREATLVARRARCDYLRLRHSVIKVQAHWRGLQARRKFLSLRQACLRAQALWRGRQARKNLTRLRWAVSLVEQRRGAALLARRTRSDYLQLRRGAIAVQAHWRGLQARRRFLQLRRACVRVQAAWRGRRARKGLLRLRWAVGLVERRREATLVARRMHSDYLQVRRSIIAAQAHWRGLQARRRFLNLRQACLRVQAVWRGRRARKNLAQLRWAVSLLERRRQATLIARRTRSDYLRARRSAIAVQSRWRGLRARQRFLALRRACVRIQAVWRGRQTRRNLQRLRWAVSLAEQRRQATLLARRTRSSYLQLQRAALGLQRRWRELREGRKRRAAAVLIQARWRGSRARRRLQALKRACRLVQARWRFARLRRAAICAQANWQARRQRRRFLQQRSAALLVQRRWRRLLEERRLAQLRWAVRVVERRRAAALTGRQALLEFLDLRWAATVLQRRWRARRRERAATRIQHWWLSLLATLRTRSEFVEMKMAVRLIEDWWIGSAERRVEWAERRRRASAAVKIQSVWRGFAVRRAASKQLAKLRTRAEQATKAAVPTATLAFRLEDSIEKFKYASNIGQLSVSLASLDLLVRLLPNACIQVCQLNLVSKLYDILTQANRSLPWLDVCLKDVSILLTLAKFKPTTEYVLKLEHIQVLARLLTVSSDKKEDLFLHTATLMWVLTENDEYAEAAKECPRTKYLLQSLCSTINRKLSKSTPVLGRCVQDVLPSPNPDWGLRNKRPRIFSSVSQAVIALASRLNIIQLPQADMQRSFNFSMHS